MPRSKKEIYSIDKLKISLNQPKETWEFINNNKPDSYIYRDGYTLYIPKEENYEDQENISVKHVRVTFQDGSPIGKLTFNNNSVYKERAFLTFDNPLFYNPFYFADKISMLSCVPPILEDMGMSVASITKMEIARDVNTSTLSRLRKLIKNENYDLIINGNKVNNKEILQDYCEIYGRKRQRVIFNYPTIYVSQKNKSMSLRVYNKTHEIRTTDKGKDYIEKWVDFGKEKIFRNELILSWKHIKEFVSSFNIDMEDPYFLGNITRPETLKQMFEYFSPRLLRFTHKQTGETITPFNIF